MTDAIALLTGGILIGGAAFALGVLCSVSPGVCRRAAVTFTLVILVIGMGETADRLGLFGQWALVDIAVAPVLRALAFLLPPLACIYAAARLDPTRPRSAGLFLPAGLVWVAFLIMEATGRGGAFLPQIVWCAFVAFSAACMVAIGRLLRTHLDVLKALFSTLPSGSVARLRRLWLVLAVPVLSIALELVLGRMAAATEAVMLGGAALRVIGVLAILFLLVTDQIAAPEPPEAVAGVGRYRNSALSAELAGGLAATLRDHMARTRAYRDPLLSLATLARQLRVPEHHLSQALNQEIGKNFYDFVNGYRVAEARQLLETTDTNVLNISLEVGFNARSTFYEAFRKQYGQTPTALRKTGATGLQRSR